MAPENHGASVMTLGALSDERGLTLIELVIAGALSMLVLAGLLAAVGAGTRAENETRARHIAFRDLRDAVGVATSDIRQATGVSTSSTPTSLDIQTLVAGAPARMIYAVENAQFRQTVCSSFDFSAPCGGTATTLVGEISVDRAFCYDTDCTASAPTSALSLLRITIARDAMSDADAPITVATDVQLRNL